jgi:hypothetical protein
MVCWSLWQGLPEFARWVKRNADARGDLHFFPDEVGGELGKQWSQGQEKGLTRATSAADATVGQVARDRGAMSVETEIPADVTNLLAEAPVADKDEIALTPALR